MVTAFSRAGKDYFGDPVFPILQMKVFFLRLVPASVCHISYSPLQNDESDFFCAVNTTVRRFPPRFSVKPK